MKTQILGSSLALALALGLIACAAPSSEDIDEGTNAQAKPVEKADTTEEGKTGETSSELRIGGLHETCALTCSGGNQTCCCGVGQKCESGATYCVCKDATDTRFTGMMFAQ